MSPAHLLLQHSSGLWDRLAALSRRYSSTTLEQGEAAAAADAAAEGPAGAEEASPADVVEAAEEEAEASLMAAGIAAVESAGLDATPVRSVGKARAGEETPTGLGSAGSALEPSPVARSGAAAPQELFSGGRWEGQPVDVAEQMDAILAHLQQRLSSLEAAAAAGGAAAAREAQPATPPPSQRPTALQADASTQTALLEAPAVQDVCFHAQSLLDEIDAPTGRPASDIQGGPGTRGWLSPMQARWVRAAAVVAARHCKHCTCRYKCAT